MKLSNLSVVYLNREDLLNRFISTPMDDIKIEHFHLTAIHVIKNADVALFQEDNNKVTKVIKTRY